MSRAAEAHCDPLNPRDRPLPDTQLLHIFRHSTDSADNSQPQVLCRSGAVAMLRTWRVSLVIP